MGAVNADPSAIIKRLAAIRAHLAEFIQRVDDDHPPVDVSRDPPYETVLELAYKFVIEHPGTKMVEVAWWLKLTDSIVDHALEELLERGLLVNTTDGLVKGCPNDHRCLLEGKKEK